MTPHKRWSPISLQIPHRRRARRRVGICATRQTDGLNRYSYDSQGRLQSASTGQGVDAPTTKYAHNALGQRVFKTEALYSTSSEAGTLLDDEAEAPGFLQSIANFFARLWSPDTSDEAPTLGANRFANETTNPTTGSTSIAPVRFNLRYPGQYFDNETGLHYNYFRSYDPRTGRYTQPDPIGLEGGWNRFGYVGGNPVNLMDPLGLWAMTFEAYRGVGGGFSFGRDPNTGQGFMNFKFGWGVGGGFKWEKNGGRPGSEGAPHGCTAGGVGADLFADLDFNAGPVQAGLQNNFGRNMGQPAPYGQFMSPNWSVGDSWGVKAGWATGGQFTVWGAAGK